MAGLPFDPYHPSLILKDKRARKVQRDESNAMAKNDKKTAADAEKVTSGPAVEAKAYLEKTSDLATEIETRVGKLVAIANDCSKSGNSDSELKKMNKEFQTTKREIDMLAKTGEVKGEAPLSGKYAQKPKILSMGEGNSPVEIKIEPLHAQGLGIDQLRVDSLSFGKKAKLELERAKQVLNQIQSAIAMKLETIATRMSSMAVENGVSKSTFSRDDNRDNYLDLKISQERAARAKGRTFGLLINIKA
ncbi:MAG: hypothetical protein JWQ35_862 [Bacteriovoracaceae bacterium]|nr:hypothetical protein [Bacteriovoracaceae bacterium]